MAIKFLSCAFNQLYIFPQFIQFPFAYNRFKACIIQIGKLQRGTVCSALRPLVKMSFTADAVVDTGKLISGTDWSVERIRRDAELLFQFINQIEWGASRPIHFVDEGEDGNTA